MKNQRKEQDKPPAGMIGRVAAPLFHAKKGPHIVGFAHPTSKPAAFSSCQLDEPWEAGLVGRPDLHILMRFVVDAVLAVDVTMIHSDRTFGVLTTGMECLSVLCIKIKLFQVL